MVLLELELPAVLLEHVAHLLALEHGAVLLGDGDEAGAELLGDGDEAGTELLGDDDEAGVELLG